MASAPVSRAPSIAPSTNTMMERDMFDSPLISSMLFSSASLADSSGIPLSSVGSDSAALRRALRGSHNSYYLGLPQPSFFPPSPAGSSSGSSIRSTSRSSSASSLRPRASTGLMAPVGDVNSPTAGPTSLALATMSTESLPAMPNPHDSEPGPAPPRRSRLASLPPSTAPPMMPLSGPGPSKLSSQSTTAATPPASATLAPPPEPQQRPSFLRRVRSAFDIRRRRKTGASSSPRTP